MKNLIITFLALFLSTLTFGQTTETENYIKMTTYRVETQDGNINANTTDNLVDSEKIEQVNYVDGLGRAKQSVAVRAGGNEEDIISHFEYDAFGRQVKDYLPFAQTVSQDGAIHTDPLTEIVSQYLSKYPTDLDNTFPNPYSEKRFEASPLNRVLEQGAPGADWTVDPTSGDDHTIVFDYEANDTDEVMYFDVHFNNGNTEDTELFYIGYHESNTLYKTITKDENWTPSKGKNHTTEEFKDKEGRVILKRMYNGSTNPHDTYYTYDRFGNLTYVMSPKGSDKLLVANQYKSFSDTFGYESIVELDKKGNPVATGGGTINISISGLTLTFDFNVNFQSTVLQQGSIIEITGGQSMPNMYVGTISGSGYSYDLNIQDGFLNVSGSGQLTSIVESFTIEIPTHSVDETAIDDLGYIYHYDNRNRLVEKKIPGKGWEDIVYNKLDQPILTRDANLKAQNKWLFTKYDVFGRIAYTGTFNSGAHRGLTQSVVNTSTTTPYVTKATSVNNIAGTTIYYSNDAYPNTGIDELLSINYYDDYNFDKDNILPASSFGVFPTDQTKSLATGSKIRTLDTDLWTTAVNYYDEKARPIYTVSKNDYLETIDYVLTQYDFTGNVLKTETIHNKTGNAQINTQNEYIYDHVNRLVSDKQRTNLLEITNLVNLERDGNTITKPASASDGWGNGFASSGKLIADGYISWSVSQSNSYTMVGLSEQNNGNGFGTIQYAFYTHNGKILIYEGDGNSTSSSVFNGNAGNDGLFTTNDVLSIERVGSVIMYKRNNDVVWTSNTTNSQELIIDGAIYKAGASIYNLQLYNDHQELIAKNTYDELGQLEKKDVGHTEALPLQSVDYTYNIRGWLKAINNPDALGTDLFGFKLGYNNPEATVDGTIAPKLYNGNISETIWKTASLNNSAPSNKHAYKYTYDHLNRIKGAYFGYGDDYTLTGIYNVVIPSYDKNGNILKLLRNGQAPNTTDYSAVRIDDLNYTYDGNKLTEVDDLSGTEGYNEGNNTGIDYTYDANGNMITDGAKEITNISYNHLNLPTQITFGNASTINYFYDASGVKLRKEFNDTENGSLTTTKYAGNYIYRNDVLMFFSHPEGYVEPDGNGAYDYIYQYKDHLGNIRLSYSDLDGNDSVNTSEIIEENNYYPFGLKHKGYNNNVSANANSVASKFKYNGVELEESLGMNLYEMEFRNYDPAIGRFTGIDPVIHYEYSPYQAFDNNPVFWADPSGADGEHYNWKTERYENDKGEKVSFETALASVGVNSDGSSDNNEDSSSSFDNLLADNGGSQDNLLLGLFGNGNKKSEDDNTNPNKIKFSTIGDEGLSQTAGINGIDKLLYTFSGEEGGTFAYAFFKQIVPYYFNLPTVSIKHGVIGKRRAGNITADAIDYAFDKLQKHFEARGGSIDTNKADQKFRGYINSYMKRYGGSVSTTPTLGFKGEITIHSESWF